MLNWGTQLYWVTLYVDGVTRVVIVDAYDEDNAAVVARLQYPSGIVYKISLANGWE